MKPEDKLMLKKIKREYNQLEQRYMRKNKKMVISNPKFLLNQKEGKNIINHKKHKLHLTITI